MGKLFGREPASIIALIGSILTTLVALNIPGLDAAAGAAIMALIVAIITAATTRPIAPSLFAGIITAGAALLAQYGVGLSDQLVAGLTAILMAAFGLASTRPQVSPKP